MSGEHAVIVTILNDSFLEDLGSTNGTVVNGKPVKKHFLQNNDVIELGKYKLKFIGEAAASRRRREGRLREDHGAAPVGDEGRRRAGEGVAAARRSGRRGAAPPGRRRRVGTAPQRCRHAGKPTAIPPRRRCKRRAAPRRRRRQCRAGRAAAGQPLGAIQLLSGANAGKELELTKPLTDARQARRAGRGADAPARRATSSPHVEGAQPPDGQRPARSALAPHALKDHDVIELAGVKMEFFLKALSGLERSLKQHLVRIAVGLRGSRCSSSVTPRGLYHGRPVHRPARQHHLRRAPAHDDAAAAIDERIVILDIDEKKPAGDRPLAVEPRA